ncbi:trans-aconitate 2-methyltransferase [Entomohabitans teleogrylli]|uniref:trans-aconitate 2-methyltransferase n=1 Tax=Entomohabitans teleogrylli TaxID=1384589 RepID=UPI00073D6418|nr:trans-aconitate 2-methyltransferase [Entomohabitans teleogrylli]
MQDWNPALYLRFDSERTRPASELLTRIYHPQAAIIADLGCGPGNSTALLRARWPQGEITGVDNSPAMLEQARAALPDCTFTRADIAAWQPPQPPDILFANASLQWLGEHTRLFPRLAGLLAPGGVLAVQMPDNWQEPTHRLMRDTAQALGYPAQAGREALLAAQTYYDLLCSSGCEVDMWRTGYWHVMPSVEAMVDWLRATGLRPWLSGLDAAQQAAFLAHYRARLEDVCPPRADGQRLMHFPRLFLVARRAA